MPLGYIIVLKEYTKSSMNQKENQNKFEMARVFIIMYQIFKYTCDTILSSDF